MTSRKAKRAAESKPSATPSKDDLASALERVAGALERLRPAASPPVDLWTADAFVWSPEGHTLAPVRKVSAVPLGLLRGLDAQAKALLANTRHHAEGLPANNALLWGARGTGKSSLIKAVHAAINDKRPARKRVALVEIHREDIPSLPRLLNILRGIDRQCLLYCDDLTFEGQDASYKALKTVLEGGIEGRPANVVLYATSNRRHMMAREMIENERAAAIHDTEVIEEKVSLSDRFGLWLGFHHIDQPTYLSIAAGYASAFKLPIDKAELNARAIEWAATRGARSGRVAWQFIQALAGELGCRFVL